MGGESWFHHRKSWKRGHPLMFRFGKPLDFGPFSDGGGYPLGFLQHAYQVMGIEDPDEVLHLCSGSMRRGVCVDVRHQVGPTVVADVRRLPFRSGVFRFALADPPYAEDYAKQLYGTGSVYPRPGTILREACRVLRPGGLVGILHFLQPSPVPGLDWLETYSVQMGMGYPLRAFTVFRRQDVGLFDERRTA